MACRSAATSAVPWRPVWVLNLNLQRKMPGPKVRVVVEPHVGHGTSITLTINENDAITRSHRAVLAIWLGFLVLVSVPMALADPGPRAQPMLPPAVLVVLGLGGASVAAYAAAGGIRRAGVVRARRAELEHFVLSLRAVPT